MTAMRILLLPGWQNSGAGHWQTLWEQRHGDVRVVQDDWAWPRRGDWMTRLDDVVQEQPDGSPLLFAAHSLGCHLVAAWAAHSRHTGRVAGAMLVAPPDLERDDLPPQLFSWRPVVRRRLPFRACGVVSRDDPFGEFAPVAGLLTDWGATVHDAGARGHLNAESGLGGWPEARGWLRALCEAGA